MDLDELLDRSAPPTARRSATLQYELQRMVADAEAAVRPRRSVLRLGLVSAIATGVLGVGTAGAMAAGIVPTLAVPWVTDSGSSCEIEFTASAAEPDGEAPSVSYTPDEQRRAVTEAKRFLAAFDYSSIKEADAIREWTDAENDRWLRGDDRAPLIAVGREVWNQLSRDLTERGLPTESVSFVWVPRCK
jgi:hypothetical protein